MCVHLTISLPRQQIATRDAFRTPAAAPWLQTVPHVRLEWVAPSSRISNPSISLSLSLGTRSNQVRSHLCQQPMLCGGCLPRRSSSRLQVRRLSRRLHRRRNHVHSSLGDLCRSALFRQRDLSPAAPRLSVWRLSARIHRERGPLRGHRRVHPVQPMPSTGIVSQHQSRVSVQRLSGRLLRRPRPRGGCQTGSHPETGLPRRERVRRWPKWRLPRQLTVHQHGGLVPVRRLHRRILRQPVGWLPPTADSVPGRDPVQWKCVLCQTKRIRPLCVPVQDRMGGRWKDLRHRQRPGRLVRL